MKFTGKSKKLIGNNIQELRFSLGETQKEFADRLNVSQNAVTMWETGKCRPKAEHAKVLKQLYKQTLSTNNKSNVSSLEKERTYDIPERLDRVTLFTRILERELLGNHNSIEKYSTEELFRELERRILKKTTYKSRHTKKF